MERSLVTCGFTTFNSAKTIQKALNSALEQTYNNIEILVVDDNSEDLTIDMIYLFFKNKSVKFELIKHNSNLGVAQARNTIVNNANGEFIVFFDSDDFSNKDRITKQINQIYEFEKNHPTYDKNNIYSPLCYCDREIIFNKKQKIYCKAMNINLNDYKYKNQIISALLFCNSFPNSSETGSTACCILCARTEVLKILGGFKSILRRYEDLDLTINAIINNIPITKVNQSLVEQYYTKAEYKNNEYRYEIRLIYKYKSWLKKRNLFKFAYFYIKLKNSFITFNFRKIIYFLLLIVYENPYLFLKKIYSTSNTIFFTLKVNLIKKVYKN